jgi:hypothetical protein
MPKAGTYFYAEILNRLGFENTGYHVSEHYYQDSKNFSIGVNTSTPSETHISENFTRVIRGLTPRQFAFGHFALPLNLHVAHRHTKYLCAYRNPKHALVSEFIDFRFRRADVEWLSPDIIDDDAQAFCLYLNRHGLDAPLDIFKEFVLYKQNLDNPLYSNKKEARSLFVNFDEGIKNPMQIREIATFLGVDDTEKDYRGIHLDVLNSETKTKSGDLPIDRQALWTRQARKIYRKSEFPHVIKYAKKAGLKLNS